MEASRFSTVNLRLSAVRKMMGELGSLGCLAEGGQPDDIPNIRLWGSRLDNWLSREQAKELLGRSRQVDPEGEARLSHPSPAGRLTYAYGTGWHH